MECAFHNQNKDIILLSVVCDCQVERVTNCSWIEYVNYNVCVCICGNDERNHNLLWMIACVHISISYAYEESKLALNCLKLSNDINTERAEHGRKMIKITIDNNNK